MPALPRYTLTQPEGSSGLVAAVSLAQTIMQIAGVRAWADLDGDIPGTVVVDDQQLRLLSAHQGEISYLRATTKRSATSAGAPGVSMVVCPVCGKWLLISSGSAPSRCTLTSGCPGSPAKVPPAARAKTTESVVEVVPVGDVLPDAPDEEPYVAHPSPDDAPAEVPQATVGSAPDNATIEEAFPQWIGAGADF